MDTPENALRTIIAEGNFPWETGMAEAVWGEEDDGTEVYGRIDLLEHMEDAYVTTPAEGEYDYGYPDLSDDEDHVWCNSVLCIEVERQGCLVQSHTLYGTTMDDLKAKWVELCASVTP